MWGGLWADDRMVTYLDGVPVATVEPFDTTGQPMHLSFSIAYHGQCTNCSTPPEQLDMWVDWVRVWQ